MTRNIQEVLGQERSWTVSARAPGSGVGWGEGDEGAVGSWQQVLVGGEEGGGEEEGIR